MIRTRDLQWFQRTWVRLIVSGQLFAALAYLFHPSVAFAALPVNLLLLLPGSSLRSLTRLAIGSAGLFAAGFLFVGWGLVWPFFAACGWVVVYCSRSDREEQGAPGTPGRWALAGTAALAAVGGFLALGLGDRLADAAGLFGRAGLFAEALAFSLFLAVATIPAHLVTAEMEFRERARPLLSRTQGPMRVLATQTRDLHQACCQASARLPKLAGREVLRATVDRLALDNLALCAHWSELDQRLGSISERELTVRIEELSAAVEATGDEVLRRRLAGQLRLCTEQQAQLGSFATRRERVLAQLQSQIALLERARLSLWMASLGDVAQQLSDGEALARTLEELSEPPRHLAEARVDLADAA